MSDTYTEVTRRGFGSNLMGSIGGAVFGVLMFLASFPLLFWNQTRPNPGAIAEKASVAVTSPAGDGQFVSVSGKLETTEKLSDDFLRPGRYVSLERRVEMYAWIEESESHERKNVGGSTTTTTEYKYRKDWTASPEDSSGFKVSSGHENPTMAIQSHQQTVSKATIGAFSFAPGECSLPGGQALELTPENAIKPKIGKPAEIQGQWIYVGYGVHGEPRVGDLKVSYLALEPGGEVTIFGQTQGDSIVPHVYKGKKPTFFRVFSSTREAAIEQMKTEFKMLGWMIGVGGFFLMWLGMTAVFGPLQAVADIIPFIGNLTGKAIGCVTFPIALVLAIVTTVVAKILTNPILLAIFALAMTVGLTVLVVSVAKRRPREG
ncbi:MAG: TMEM43 family protein [Fimbriimonadaceae bacterium]|nr:TMEM43 family protein [Fimbriimonadaceae bacterium]